MKIRSMFVPAAAALSFAFSLAAQDASQWSLGHRVEVRANYRNSSDESFRLRFPFPPDFLQPGETAGSLRTPDPGSHAELSVANVQLDAAYGRLFAARARVHLEDKYRKNPTSSDRQVDADELWIRIGEAPEFLERPAGTSVFAQVGKAPRVERQPTRLLESYGLAATSFNRFEDTQLIVGGTFGRNLYWRLIAANGNPLFFRDPDALAGDNGTPQHRNRPPNPKYHSGFPILYNAEGESLAFDTSNVQYGEAVGYRWANDAETWGFDAIAFHYERDLADEANLTGTFYGGDLDLLDGVGGISLPISGRKKEEYGSRVYAEWRGATAIAQFTKQHVAGLQRQGYEVEAGYRFPLSFGPVIRGTSLVHSIQPAARLSGLTNRFRGPRTFVAPSVWWPWTKIDAGVRVGFAAGFDLTVEYAKHNIGAPRKLDRHETLVTLRWRG